MSAKMRHWYSNEWYSEERNNISTKSATQEELQKIAEKIRKGCKVEEITDNGFEICTIYTNEAVGVKYWVHDSFGWISTIDEARFY